MKKFDPSKFETDAEVLECATKIQRTRKILALITMIYFLLYFVGIIAYVICVFVIDALTGDLAMTYGFVGAVLCGLPLVALGHILDVLIKREGMLKREYERRQYSETNPIATLTEIISIEKEISGPKYRTTNSLPTIGFMLDNSVIESDHELNIWAPDGITANKMELVWFGPAKAIPEKYRGLICEIFLAPEEYRDKINLYITKEED